MALFAATQYFSRFWSEADIDRQARLAESVVNEAGADLAAPDFL
jgi:hypothetical protein